MKLIIMKSKPNDDGNFIYIIELDIIPIVTYKQLW